jgi:outer membrane receptor protein involved in Fe transport
MRKGLVWAAMMTASLPVVAMAQTPAPSPVPPGPGQPPAPGKTVGELVVNGRAPAVVTSIDRKSYSVTNDLRATTGSIGEALRNVPSVDVDVQGAVSLRGDANVTILIDGKPSSQFSGEARGQALQQLPAERIDRIEVITNPSAEFRADGSAGIINLVTKKARGAGLTGGSRVSFGNDEQVYGGANFGYNSRQLSLNGDLFFRHDPQKQTQTEERFRPDPTAGGALAETRLENVGHADFNIVGARGAVDYDLDPRTRISGELRGQYIDSNLDLLAHTEREDGRQALAQIFDRGVSVEQQRGNGEATLGLTRKFDGDRHDLKLNLSYEITEEDRTRAGVTLNVLPPLPGVYDRQHVLTSLRQLQFKGDYQRPVGERGRLKLGFDIQHDDNSYDNRGFRGLSPPARVPDPTLTNLFEYEQLLSQAYATYERPFGDITVLAGLRLEDVRLDLDQVTVGLKAENDYFRAYPSLHLAWKASATDTFTASYSHRVQRPQPEDYNAFRFLIDPITFRSGNTRLKPQETHSFELGWQYRKAGAVYQATAYYRENYRGLTEVTRDLGGGVYLISRANLSKTRDGGVELAANGRLTRALTYNASANVYYRELDPLDVAFDRRRTGTILSGRAQFNWQVTPDDFIQFGGFLNGKVLTPQGSISPTGMLNLGYRHKVGDRFALIVQAQDVLRTFDQKITLDTPTLKDTVRREVNTELVLVGFSWTFGGGRPRDPGFDFQQGGGPPQ